MEKGARDDKRGEEGKRGRFKKSEEREKIRTENIKKERKRKGGEREGLSRYQASESLRLTAFIECYLSSYHNAGRLARNLVLLLFPSSSPLILLLTAYFTLFLPVLLIYLYAFLHI